MGAVRSSSGDAMTATKSHAQHSRSDAVGGADWSSLAEHLLLIIMAALDIPSLIRSGAICTSWHDAYSTFRALRRRSPKQAPCLLYACDEYGPNHAALYCPSTNTTFRVPFPHHGRGRFFSSNGWVFATDEVADAYLLNPVTGDQAMLPPVKTIPCMEIFLDDNGNPSEEDIKWARDNAYWRVAISAAGDDAATCTVLVVHLSGQMLSFAKPGDERWTLLSRDLWLDDVHYNDRNGLFYGLCSDGSVYVFDLGETSPVVTRIMRRVTTLDPAKYLVITPSGELCQVWRIWDAGESHTQIKHSRIYKNLPHFTSQGCIDFTGRDDPGGLETEEEEDTTSKSWQKIAVSTGELLVFKVDIERQKLVELRSIGEHALFLGYNSAVCLSTIDFPAFQPNRAYLTDDGSNSAR
ncbi:hypothetical protein ACQ4PT_057127 [Festuca glaucescens]